MGPKTRNSEKIFVLFAKSSTTNLLVSRLLELILSCFFFSICVHYSFESNMSAVAQIAAKLHSVDEQRELFLWKYRDVKREDVNELMKVTFAVLIIFQMK